MNFFITGATGFIGKHLTKALVEKGEAVTVLLNQSTNLEWLESTPDNFHSVKIDLLDTEALAQALQGHDVVVHLAYSSRGTPEEQRRIIVEGTQSILSAAAKSNVSRFVHMSSAATYGEPPKDRVYTERHPRYASLALYPSLKQEAELAVLNNPHSSTEVVILQPSIIYGPGDGYWTAGILDALSKNGFPLVNNGDGLCNLIHVCDVVEAIQLASTAPDINAECFILANDDPVTWKTFFSAYENILGKKCLFKLSIRMMKRYNIWKRYQRKIPEYKLYTKALKVIFNLARRQNIRKPIKIPDNERLDFFAAKPHFSNQKAKNLLGFNPRVTFEAGIQTIRLWTQENQIHDRSL